MNPPKPAHLLDPLATILDYHERTKHQLKRYAAGPETLDWSAQPEAFRWYDGAPQVELPLTADELATPYSAFARPDSVAAAPLTLRSLATLLELTLGLAAWKEYGPDRWALRCNPSSGNLHPTEGYLLSHGLPELADGVHHYLSRDHALERRAELATTTAPGSPRVWLALSSIHWREAWKYGERAFRYCQLDTGHAIGALRYAAAALGWRVHWLEGVSSCQLAQLLGLDRAEDYGKAEREEPELLLEISCGAAVARVSPPDWSADSLTWQGTANRLDRHPMYRWPVIDQVAEATLVTGSAEQPACVSAEPPLLAPLSDEPAATLIRQRRSAQHFDRKQTLSLAAFYRLLDAVLARSSAAPWDCWRRPARIHPVIFVHRVEGLEQGVYVLPRSPDAEHALRTALRGEFAWNRVPGKPDHLPLYQLASGDCGTLSRAMHCHQAIGQDAAFALGMLAEFEPRIAQSPWEYRWLYWEAGLLGQVLYLEAEALGIRGTGIGCYFDDEFHDLLGLNGREWQSLYHFTVGFPLTDTRIMTLPPYAHLSRAGSAIQAND